MTEIEFLEPAHGPDESGRDTNERAPWVPRDRAARSLPAAAAAVFAVTASALCVAAAFQRLYRLRFGSGGGAVDIDVDARGRYSGPGAGGANLQHSADYAVILWSCATSFAALAVLGAAAAVGHRHRLLRPITLALGTATAGVLAGLLLAIRAEVQATFDTVRATLEFSAQNGDPVNGRLATQFGPCVILGTLALLCAVAAVAAAAFARPRRRVVDVALPPDPGATGPAAEVPDLTAGAAAGPSADQAAGPAADLAEEELRT